MHQSLRQFGFIALVGLLLLPNSGQSNENLRTAQNPRVTQHLAFIEENFKKMDTLKDSDFGSACSASHRRFAYRAGYAQALQMTSTVAVVSDDLDTPDQHPLISALLGPEKDPSFLTDTYKAVEIEFASNNPLNNAMLCYTAASLAFNAQTGAPRRPHADLREEMRCCIQGYKKGREETLRALNKKPSPSELCVELFNAGVDEVKPKCKNLDCHRDISDAATRRRLILTTVFNAVQNDFTEFLRNKFAFCFPESTTRERNLKYEQMLPQLRSCFSAGRAAGMQECTNLTLQGQEPQSAFASPVTDQSKAQGPAPTTTSPEVRPAKSGATAE